MDYEYVKDDLPLNLNSLAEATAQDTILAKVYDYTLQGWPQHVNDSSLALFFKVRLSLSVKKNVLLYANRVVIPLALQASVLKLLYEGHPGIVRMNSLRGLGFGGPQSTWTSRTL